MCAPPAFCRTCSGAIDRGIIIAAEPTSISITIWYILEYGCVHSASRSSGGFECCFLSEQAQSAIQRGRASIGTQIENDTAVTASIILTPKTVENTILTLLSLLIKLWNCTRGQLPLESDSPESCSNV